MKQLTGLFLLAMGMAQTVTAQLVSLVPGSVVVELDSPRGLLSVHAFAARTAADVETARADVLAQEERVLRALAAHRNGAQEP